MGIAETWGSTPDERARPWPCDGLVDGAELELFRAVDVDAPPEVTFRWLCQLRAAPYPKSLQPGLERLSVGQRVMSIFRLVKFEHGRSITLRIDTPTGERIFGDLAVTYEVSPRGERGSRIAVKIAVKPPRSLLAGALSRLLPWGDLVMMRRQLLTLKELAERERNLLPRRHISS